MVVSVGPLMILSTLNPTITPAPLSGLPLVSLTIEDQAIFTVGSSFSFEGPEFHVLLDDCDIESIYDLFSGVEYGVIESLSITLKFAILIIKNITV